MGRSKSKQRIIRNRIRLKWKRRKKRKKAAEGVKINTPEA